MLTGSNVLLKANQTIGGLAKGPQTLISPLQGLQGWLLPTS